MKPTALTHWLRQCGDHPQQEVILHGLCHGQLLSEYSEIWRELSGAAWTLVERDDSLALSGEGAPVELDEPALHQLRRAAIHGRYLLDPEIHSSAIAFLDALGQPRMADPGLFSAGTWGAAMTRRAFDEVRVDTSAGQIEVVACHLLRCDRDARRNANHTRVVVLRLQGTFGESWFAEDYGGQLTPELDTPAGCDVVRNIVTKNASDPRGLAFSLTHPRRFIEESTRAAWFLTIHRVAGGRLWEQTVGETTVMLDWDVPLQEEHGFLDAVFTRTVTDVSGSSSSQESYPVGFLQASDYEAPAPKESDPVVRAAVELWRTENSQHAAAVLAKDGRHAGLHDLVLTPFITDLVRIWLDRGPWERRPAIAVSPERLQQLVPTVQCSLSRVDGASDRGGTDDREVRDAACLKVESWRFYVVRRVRWVPDEAFGWLPVVSLSMAIGKQSEPAVEIATTRQWPRMLAPAGHPQAFRDFSTALRELVLCAGKDVRFKAVGRAGGAPASRSLRLSELLEFGDREKAPVLDGRLEMDFAEAESPADTKRRLWEDADALAAWGRGRAIYLACIHDLFDPNFTLPEVSW